jgi:hypothetical protein
MKMHEAMDVIEGRTGRKGYVVKFEVRENGMLRSDHFPDVLRGEPGIDTEEAAWNLAQAFANKSGADFVNIYVCRARDFMPVEGYGERTIRPYGWCWYGRGTASMAP